MIVRAMRQGEEAPVAEMVGLLTRETVPGAVPRLTGEMLRANGDLLEVTVAAEGGDILGACLALQTFSTWRGARGLYIVDLFVGVGARGRGIGQTLLRGAAQRGRDRGAQFIKLEVDLSNGGAARFYERLGFARKADDRLFVLERDRMELFLEGRPPS